MLVPQNATEVHSFLDFIQHLARFIKQFASISAPIRPLAHKNAKWLLWLGPEQQQHASGYLIGHMATPEVMKYINSSLKTELIVDGSPVGLGVILTHVNYSGWQYDFYFSIDIHAKHILKKIYTYTPSYMLMQILESSRSVSAYIALFGTMRTN